MKDTGVEVHVIVGLEAQREALVALQAQTIVLWSCSEHGIYMHIMATGTRGDILLGVTAVGEFTHLSLMALTAKGGVIFIAEQRWGWAADDHAPRLMYIVAVDAGGRILSEMCGGQKALFHISSRSDAIRVAFRTSQLLLGKRAACRIADKQSRASPLSNVG